MITVSNVASKHILEQLEKRGKGIGIKVGVRTTGCSGLSYTLEWVDQALTTDIEYQSENVRLFVDPKNIPYLDGTELQWIKNGINWGFEFRNPNERDRCGCGESFTV